MYTAAEVKEYILSHPLFPYLLQAINDTSGELPSALTPTILETCGLTRLPTVPPVEALLGHCRQLSTAPYGASAGQALPTPPPTAFTVVCQEEVPWLTQWRTWAAARDLYLRHVRSCPCDEQREGECLCRCRCASTGGEESMHDAGRTQDEGKEQQREPVDRAAEAVARWEARHNPAGAARAPQSAQQTPHTHTHVRCGHTHPPPPGSMPTPPTLSLQQRINRHLARMLECVEWERACARAIRLAVVREGLSAVRVCEDAVVRVGDVEVPVREKEAGHGD